MNKILRLYQSPSCLERWCRTSALNQAPAETLASVEPLESGKQHCRPQVGEVGALDVDFRRKEPLQEKRKAPMHCFGSFDSTKLLDIMLILLTHFKR